VETLRKRLEETKRTASGRQQMGWNGGHLPFGAYANNPEGVRIGQNESRHQRAVKVWV